mmetsp:Transcript_113501/g.270343  ORF Transcript_113501/g.270343 Transcript_113501/m.270343 type:complete len:123 (-) Transcript_113501:93-461(-)
MPLRLDPGWNQLTFNLADFTKRAFQSNYVETLRVTVHANCRLRRVFFMDRLYETEELPADFRLAVLNRTAAALPVAPVEPAPVPPDETWQEREREESQIHTPTSTAATESDLPVLERWKCEA